MVKFKLHLPISIRLDQVLTIFFIMIQENEEDFVSLSKNDPKYQTLPYNAKLFNPFANKHEQDQFEKSMQQMQIIKQDQQSAATAQLQFQVQQYRQQQQQQQQQSNQHSNQFSSSNSTINDTTSNNSNGPAPTNSERVQSYNNKNNLHLNQLQSFLSQQQNNQNAPKSATTSLMTTSTTSSNNGAQAIHSTQANNDGDPRGKVGNENALPIIRPSSFLPTGAPASSPSTSSTSSASASNGSPQMSHFGGSLGQNGYNGQVFQNNLYSTFLILHSY